MNIRIASAQVADFGCTLWEASDECRAQVDRSELHDCVDLVEMADMIVADGTLLPSGCPEPWHTWILDALRGLDFVLSSMSADAVAMMDAEIKQRRELAKGDSALGAAPEA